MVRRIRIMSDFLLPTHKIRWLLLMSIWVDYVKYFEVTSTMYTSSYTSIRGGRGSDLGSSRPARVLALTPFCP
jgi:hypothetical protein